jgi:tripartite-type tricarboxylate transporter receptor subunit TctC
MFNINRRTFLAGAGAAALSTTASERGLAQAGTTNDLTWLIYQAPGGSVDLSTRTLQPGIEAAGFKVRLEYAQGAGGRIARTRLFNAPKDGSVIMTDVAPAAVVDQYLYNVPYKVDSFDPIFGWILNGFQYCVKKDSAIRTFADFIAECKRRRVTVGTIGRGGAFHLHVVAMRKALDLDFNIVHFDGSSPAYTAVLGGHVDVAGGGAGSGSRQQEVLHFLGMSGSKREQALPNVPTITELGYKVPVVEQLYFAHTSPGTPEPQLKRLKAAFQSTLTNPEIVKRMEAAGDFLTLIPPEQINDLHKAQSDLVLAYKDALRQ